MLFTLAKEHRVKRELIESARSVQRSARKKLLLVLLSALYYGLLLAYLVGREWGAAICYTLLLHMACCSVESLVRATTITAPECAHLESAVLTVQQANQRNQTTVRNLANAVLQVRAAPALSYLCFGVALLASLLYALVPTLVSLSFDGFSACGLLVNWTLCFVALSAIGKTLLQLHERLLVARAYHGLTGRHDEIYLDLAIGWNNVLGWLSLRTYLLSRSRQPQTRIAAEMVLSTAVLLLGPVWLVLIAQMLLGQFGEASALSLCICGILGLFLMGAVQQAAALQRVYRDTLPLKTAQLRVLTRQEQRLVETQEPLFHDDSVQSKRFLEQLKLLDSIAGEQEEGILFCVLGMPLNEKAVMVMLWFLASVVSSGFTELTNTVLVRQSNSTM